MRTYNLDFLFAALLAAIALVGYSFALHAADRAPTDLRHLEANNLYEMFLHQYEKNAPGRWDNPRGDVTYQQNRGLKLDPQVQASNSRQANGDPLRKHGMQTYDYSVSQSSPWGSSVSLFYNENRQSGSSEGDTTPLPPTASPTSKATGVRLTQQLLKDGPFGGLLTDDLASLERDINRIEASVKKEDALFQVISSFLNYNLAHKGIEQNRAALDSAIKQNAIVHQLVAGGYKPRADILVSDGVELRARQDLAAAVEAERVALDDLMDRLFWQRTDGRLEVGDTTVSQPIVGRLDHLIREPYSGTPHLAIAETHKKRAVLNLKKAKRDNLPSLSVEYTAQKNLTPANSENGDDGRTNSITLNLAMPLGSMIEANNVAAARMDEQSSGDELINQRDSDARTDDRLLRDVTLKESAYAAELKLHEFSRKSLEIERQKYTDGKSSISDLKTYQDQHDQATRRLDEAAKALNLAKFNLAHHRGELTKVFVP